jgi:hypothetical protein
MSDPVLDLQSALLSFLRGQGALTERLGSPARVYDELPEQVDYPYVAFGRTSVQAIGGIGPDVTEQTLNLLCVSRFGGTEEAKAIAGLLRGLLDDAELALDEQHFVSLRVVFVDVFRASDFRTIYALLRLRAVSEALA